MKEWFFAFIIIFAQISFSKQYFFRNYTIADGLIQSQVQVIIQDNEGYLWFGTLNGLSRFDGQQFVNFTIRDGLAGSAISAAAKDTNGIIWFGDENGGITRYNYRTHRFNPLNQYYNHPSSGILDILIDQKHNIWFGTFSSGLFKFNGDSLIQYTIRDGLGSMRISALCQMPNGDIWIGYDGGISILHDSKNVSPETISDFQDIPELKRDLVTDILLDSRNRLWIATQLSGVYVIDYTSNFIIKSIQHFHQDNFLPANWVLKIFQDRSGTIWLATFGGGLVKIKENNGNFFFETFDTSNGLAYDRIAEVYQDTEGNIWIGTYGAGVCQYLGKRFTYVTTSDGLEDNIIWSIYRDSYGDLWFGTNSGFNYFPDKKKAHFAGKTHNFHIGNQVLSIAEDPWHNLYFATYSKGLYRLDLSSGKLSHFTIQDGLPSNYLSQIKLDAYGQFWISTFAGDLVKFIPQPKGKPIFQKILKFSVPIFTIFPDSTGALWIGCDGKGLYKFKNNQLKNIVEKYNGYSLCVNSITQDSEGAIWFSTAGQGLFCYKGDSLHNYSVKDGLTTESCTLVISDYQDNIWVGHARGIDRFDGKKFDHFDKADGYIGLETNQNAVFKDPEGFLWFGTVGGAMCYNYREDRRQFSPPPVNITKIELFHQSIPIDSVHTYKPEQNFFIFYFTGINFYNPYRIKYSYILEGFDDQWSPLSKNQFATYSNLPSGEYTFKVKACFNDTLWSRQAADYHFVIQTPFLKSQLFLSLLTVSLILLAFFAYRLRVQAIERRNRFLEEKVKERTRLIIEEKKKTEKAFHALQESEEIFKALAESTSSAIFIYQGEFFRYVNPATEKITGYTRDELLQMKFWELAHPDYKEQIRRMGFARQKGENVLPAYEFKIVRKDGEERWIHLTATYINFRNKPAALGTAYDISDRKIAEESLRESETRYRLLFDMLPFGGEILDENGVIVDCSTSVTQLLGYSREEIIGKHITDFLAEEYRANFIEKHQQLLQGKTIQTEVVMIHKSGKRIHVMRAARPFYKRDGTLWGIIALSNDITELKNMELAHRESEERLRTLINAMPDTVCFKDGEGRWMESNIYNLKLFGLLNVPYKGKKNSELGKYNKFYQDALITCEKSDKLAWKKGTLVRMEETIPQPDGSEKVFDVIKVPIFYPDGKRKGLVVIGRDITDRKRAEQALLEEKEKLAVTLHSIGEAVIAIDKNYRIMIINRAAQNLIGWKEEEALGKKITEVVQPLSLENNKPIKPIVLKVLETGKKISHTEDLKIVTRNGEERLINETASPIFDKNGVIIGVVVVYRDITEKRHLENELIKMQKLESLGILAGGIAHDFNNILTSIMGNISLAKINMDKNDPLYKRLEGAENATMRARDLTHQLLTFSKGGAPVKKATSIRNIIVESTQFTLAGSNVGFKTHFDENLWEVEADKGQISQVIQNLVINAQQAMPNGGYIEIFAQNVHISKEDRLPLKPGRYVKIMIKDHGHGIPEKYLAKIFDPYFTTKKQGNGLGLATTYSIIKKHNGYITVESRVNVGTTFIIYLPAATKKETRRDGEQNVRAQFRGKVLVMDDEKDVQQILGNILEFLGFTPEFASHGEEAIQKYQNAMQQGEPFVLTIMDLTVPKGMGGREAITRLKKIDPNIKAIVFSGYSNDTVISEFRRYGFSGYIGKPFKVEELKKVIASVLNAE